MKHWYEHLYTAPPGPDRVERLLASCRTYYLHGDRDIAILLAQEVLKELGVTTLREVK